MSSAIAPKAIALTLATDATPVVTCVLISAKSSVSVRLIVRFEPTLNFMTATTESNATSKESAWLAPAPSAAAAKAFITVIIW